MLRATVFDLEDTLIDSGAAWVNTWAAYTARHGHRWTAADSAAAHGNDSWSSYISTLCGGLPASQVARDCSQVMVSALAGGGIEAAFQYIAQHRRSSSGHPLALALRVGKGWCSRAVPS